MLYILFVKHVVVQCGSMPDLEKVVHRYIDGSCSEESLECGKVPCMAEKCRLLASQKERTLNKKQDRELQHGKKVK